MSPKLWFISSEGVYIQQESQIMYNQIIQEEPAWALLIIAISIHSFQVINLYFICMWISLFLLGHWIFVIQVFDIWR
jgi:hypothetical protein